MKQVDVKQRQRDMEFCNVHMRKTTEFHSSTSRTPLVDY